MKPLLKALLCGILTTLLIYVLHRPWGDAVPMSLGQFLSPSHGFWQNAEATSADFGGQFTLEGLHKPVEILLDERLVPHIFADDEEDLYFTQGYLHAKFRLFQMDLQTRAAAGRASEIAGPKAIGFDREQRRLGMVYAAENALTLMEKDPTTLRVFNAYTAGVNAYINSLSPKDWPVEYKLLNVAPAPWSNLRSALLLKMMAKMLAGGTESDLGYTRAKSVFSLKDLSTLYPMLPDSLEPIIPKGTPFAAPAIVPKRPENADSVYFSSKSFITYEEMYPANPANGSNNWVVNGTKTASGAPILCNDPHLELSLPSIWYESQLTSPTSNTYGVSLPGVPFIIIGFNDHVAWGVTNAQRDVKDYFSIRFKDETKKEYWYNNAWHPTQLRLETISVKNAPAVIDTVAYTVFGPVMYDSSFPVTGQDTMPPLAVRWIAHEPSNEGKTFYLLNRATSYQEYTEALKYYDCPGQNFIFASKTGDIAIWQQGKFPARWEGQGVYTMPGYDSTYNWQGYIPMNENPHILNPSQGFLQSANQRPVDGSYPYFIPGTYLSARGSIIHEKLNALSQIQVEDMKQLLFDYTNLDARRIRPTLLRLIQRTSLTESELQFLKEVEKWDLQASPESVGQTIYQCWMDSLHTQIFADEINQAGLKIPMPRLETTLELLLKDTTSHFYDNKQTPIKENVQDIITQSFQKACIQLTELQQEDKLAWARFKSPAIQHLLKNAVASFGHEQLQVGGNNNTINAITKHHGPSWRMVVELTDQIQAFGVYPSGQQGNPGSKYYDNFISTWEKGDLYPLKMLQRSAKAQAVWSITLQPH